MSAHPGRREATPARFDGATSRLFAAPPVWAEKGACADVDPELFYPAEGERGPRRRAREARAKKVCAACVVRAECLTWALETQEPHGVWGGHSEDEREALAQMGAGS